MVADPKRPDLNRLRLRFDCVAWHRSACVGLDHRLVCGVFWLHAGRPVVRGEEVQAELMALPSDAIRLSMRQARTRYAKGTANRLRSGERANAFSYGF